MRDYENTELVPCLCDMKDIMWYDYIYENYLYELDDMADEGVIQGNEWFSYMDNVFEVQVNPSQNRVCFVLIHKSGLRNLEQALDDMRRVAIAQNEEDDNDPNYIFQKFVKVCDNVWAIEFYKTRKSIESWC